MFGDENDRWKIGVAGLSPGAGVSFLTVCMAGCLAEGDRYLPAVAELGTAGIFDTLGMERRFGLKEFNSFYRAAGGQQNLRKIKNEAEGINWALRLPGERGEPLAYREGLRLIYGLCGDVVFFDFSGRTDEEGWLMMREMDELIAVIDPRPTALLAGIRTLERWKLSGLSLHYVINKDNDGVDHRELSRFLKIKRAETIPFLPPELVYGIEFSGSMPWKDRMVQEKLKPVLGRLLSDILNEKL